MCRYIETVQKVSAGIILQGEKIMLVHTDDIAWFEENKEVLQEALTE